jgi:hypothetical protein
MYNYVLCIELFIIFIILLTYVYWLFNKYIDNNYSNDKYGTLINVLILTIENYKVEIYTPQYELLLKKYDLDNNSLTNAQKLFNQVHNNLIKSSAKDICENYISLKTIKSLMNYHSLNGILLIIINKLKEGSSL